MKIIKTIYIDEIYVKLLEKEKLNLSRFVNQALKFLYERENSESSENLDEKILEKKIELGHLEGIKKEQIDKKLEEEEKMKQELAKWKEWRDE
jgi:hypothetical protein